MENYGLLYSYLWSGNNAEEKLEEVIKDRKGNGETVIEGTIEKELGKYKYWGRGVLNEHGMESWCFMSDELYGDISIVYTEGGSLEDYFSLIEELE